MRRWGIALPCCLAACCFAQTGCRSTKGPDAPTGYVPIRVNPGATFATFRDKRVVEAAMHYPSKELEPVSQVPMSLTGSDGTGLNLVSLEGKAVIEGPLAFTELHLTFRNPQDRVREGRFTITLPPGAAVSRFAMKLHGGWQEAEVVERQAARQIYEDFLHRRQDPALLEKKAGNEFRARIFPIPANGEKEIIISYSQNLPRSDQPFRLYLKGLPRIESLKLTAMVGEQQQDAATSSLGGVVLTQKVVRVRRKNYAPEDDFIVRGGSRVAGLRHGNLAAMRVKPELSSERAPLQSLLVLVDTSASRAAGFYHQVVRVGAVIDQLEQIYGGQLPLHVACFDQRVGSVYQGPIGQFSREHLDLILARRPLGASDLGTALEWARTGAFSRILLVTDGVATAGDTEATALRDRVKQLATRAQRLDVMLVGGIRDEAGAKRLVTGTLPADGVVIDADQPAAQIARRLSQTTTSGITVSVPAARWVWPKRLDGVQPGDEVLVFADLADNALPAGKPLVAVLGGSLSQRHEAMPVTVKRPLLERAWVEARIARLEDQRQSGEMGPDMQTVIKKQIIELSTKHRVLSDYTALLVLETENDYARYGIRRTALAQILVVGAEGVEVSSRTAIARRMIERRPPPRPPRDRRPRRRTGDAPLPGAQAGRATSTGRLRAAPAAPAGTPSTDITESDVTAEPTRSQAVPDARKTMARPPARRSLAKRSAPRRMDTRMEQRPAELRPAPRARVADETDVDTAASIARPPQPKRKRRGPPALSGKLAEIYTKIEGGDVQQALVDALRWRAEQPGNVMALLALGMALEAHGNTPLAARVYGSIIDLFPSRADMRRFAGQRLEALGRAGLELATDSYKRAVEQRPDHQSSHRLLAFALLRLGQHETALAALEAGLTQSYRISRRGIERIFRDDLGLVAAALVAKAPDSRPAVEQRLAKLGAQIASRPSLRFVINWETDANDVDFHIHDGQGGHAYYSRKQLPSGGVLYADVTNGFGPECFAIDGPAAGYPYELEAHYYSRGPMGYGMGKLQIIEHDGRGKLAFEDRPFVVMNDRAYVPLGQVKGPLLDSGTEDQLPPKP